MLGSVCAGSGVDSVGEDICSAVSHIRANFPGAHASQRGDLLTLSSGRGWCWVGRGARGVWAREVPSSTVGTADEEPWEHWFGSLGTSTEL